MDFDEVCLRIKKKLKIKIKLGILELPLNLDSVSCYIHFNGQWIEDS